MGKLQKIITVIAIISLAIGIGFGLLAQSFLMGIAVAIGSFIGISRIVGPALDPNPNSYDSKELREIKNARNLQRAADAAERAAEGK